MPLLTYKKFGYYPSTLSPQSNKLVVVKCRQCKENRILTKQKAIKSDRCKTCNCADSNLLGVPKSKQHATKISNALRGLKKTAIHCQHIREARLGRFKAEQNPFWGRRHTLKTKRKMRANQPNKCGNKNPMWKGGISVYPYTSEFTTTLKNKIRDRDQHKCVLCHISEHDCYRKLDVHHIDYDKTNSNVLNLVSLCSNCHMRTNSNRSYWTALFNTLRHRQTIEHVLN